MKISLISQRVLAVVIGMVTTPSVFGAPPVIHSVYEDPERLVISHVEASFAHFAEAASGFFLDAYANRRVTQEQFDQFSRRFLTGTFIEAQYIYTVSGVTRVRTYHASSGDVGQNPLTPGGVPRNPFFTYFDEGAPEIVARWGPVEDSTVTHRPLDDGRHPDARRQDAEIKAAQSLEHDIVDGIVPRGGRLVIHSSQVPCDSCDPALEALSDRYGIRVDVHVLSARSPAYRWFDRQRRNYMSTVLRIAVGRTPVRPTTYAGTTTPRTGESFEEGGGPGVPAIDIPAQCPSMPPASP